MHVKSKDIRTPSRREIKERNREKKRENREKREKERKGEKKREKDFQGQLLSNTKRKKKYIGRNAQNLKKWLLQGQNNSTLTL